MAKKRRDPYMLRRFRQIVQIVFLGIFVFLLVKALLGRTLGSWTPLLIMTLTTTILTLVLGRVWCGWACPLGTILYWVRFKGAIERGNRLSKRWLLIKYVLLFLILAAALLDLVRPVADWMDRNPVARPTVIILILAAGVGLNLVAHLSWCRYLCPLGGAVALLSKIAPMQRIVRTHCNDCSVCVDACPMGTVDPRHGFVSDPGECTVCMDCLTACTSSSNGFRFTGPFGGQR